MFLARRNYGEDSLIQSLPEFLRLLLALFQDILQLRAGQILMPVVNDLLVIDKVLHDSFMGRLMLPFLRCC